MDIAEQIDRYFTLTDDGATAVGVEVSGGFPGSPVRLGHTFRFAPDGHIAVLTIRV